VPGLYNSTSWSAGVFCNQRLNARQYLGVNFQHSRIVSFLNGPDSILENDNLFPFYTIYLRNSVKSVLSLSVTGGPQHYSASQSPATPVQGWEPAGTVGVGWQGHLSSLAASFSRYLTGGGGLSGAYVENSASAFFRRELTRTWEVDLIGFYATTQNKTPLFTLSEPGGHTISGSVQVQHSLTRNLKFQVGYERMDQNYAGIAALAKLPNSDREYGSITWLFTRPLGR
jgi:hypothetical protein